MVYRRGLWFLALCVAAAVCWFALRPGVHVTVKTTALFLGEGNSQLAGTNNDLFDQLKVLLYGAPDTKNIASAGETVANFQSDVATEFGPLTAERNGRVVVLIFDATNSLGLGGLTGQETYDQMCELAASNRSYYPQAIVIATTIPFRDFQGGRGFDPDPADINSRIRDYNTLLLANSLGRFDAVADVQRLLGDDPTLYSTDRIHLNIEPYVAQVAALLAHTINPFLGERAQMGDLLRSGLR